MPTLVTMPKWSPTMTAGTVAAWIAGEGESVTAGAPLLTIQSENGVNDVEAPADGILLKIVAEAGTEVSVGGPVGIIAAPDETLSDDEIVALVAEAATVATTDGAAVSPIAPEERAPMRDAAGRVNASPAARKLAQQLGVDLATVEATGPGGRITSEDVERSATAAARAAAAPREEMIALPDSRRLFAVLAGPPSATPPLVFLHGIGSSQSSWTNLLDGLADRYRVAALDLPGHGRSDKPDPAAADYSIAGLSTTVGEAIAALDWGPAVLLGHALGGAVALQIALDRPKLVRGLVLIDSAGLGDEISPELLDRVDAEPSREEARRLLELYLEDKGLITERGIDELHLAWSSPGADTALKAIAAASFGRDGQKINLRDRLGELTVPTAFVWGELDRVIPVEQGAAASALTPGAWLDVLEGIGHVPQIETTAALTKLIDEFTRALPAPSASPGGTS